jgi:UPF0176 protein
MTIVVSTFYKFAVVSDPVALEADVAALCCRHGIKGTFLVAPEGINASVSGAPESVAELMTWLRLDIRFQDLESKDSFATDHPFRRLKVKVKPEIVTFGHPEIDPVAAGTHVRAEDWNALIQQPDVVVIDTRNAYEVGIGTFPGAIDPATQTFQEFAAFADRELDARRHQKIAMFCTGGIRCEKATAYLRARGFGEVYHLQGGILKYLDTVPATESLWQGACFIFDERVALEHGVRAGGHRLCGRCGAPVKVDEQCQVCRGHGKPINAFATDDLGHANE